MHKRFLLLILLLSTCICQAQNQAAPDTNWIRENYIKTEQYITMRDGVRLAVDVTQPVDADGKVVAGWGYYEVSSVCNTPLPTLTTVRRRLQEEVVLVPVGTVRPVCIHTSPTLALATWRSWKGDTLSSCMR